MLFVAKRSIPVFWGNGGSIMEADWICYRELAEKEHKWKRVANIAGTELPFVSIQRFREKLKNAGGSVMEIASNTHPKRQKQYYETIR